MRFIIVGAGDVGLSLAERLTQNNHEVVLIERDESHIEKVPAYLDLQIIQGNGCHPESLIRAGVNTADYIVAVAHVDEVNISACLSAKLINPDVKRIARIRSLNFVHPEIPPAHVDEYFDLIINPDQAGADYLFQLYQIPGAKEVVKFAGGRLQVLGLQIGPKSPFVHRKVHTLKELNIHFPVILIAILRGDKLIVPRGNDKLLVGDIVYAMTTPENLKDLYELAGENLKPPKNAMIWGGSALGLSLAHAIEDLGSQVKLILSDHQNAVDTVDEFKGALILKGTGTDSNLLVEENVKDTDAFIAASPHEEDNILAALLAKKLGAPRAMALVNKASYIPLVTAIGVDVVVSTHIAAAAQIFRHIHRDAVLAEFALKQREASFLEFEAAEGASFVNKPIKELNFPQGTLVGAIVRGDEVIIPSGETEIKPKDLVVLFVAKTALKKVQKMLNLRLELIE